MLNYNNHYARVSIEQPLYIIQLYNRMKCMGVCLSHRSTLNAMDKLGKDFDSHVHLWKAEVAKLLLSAKVECTLKCNHKLNPPFLSVHVHAECMLSV